MQIIKFAKVKGALLKLTRKQIALLAGSFVFFVAVMLSFEKAPLSETLSFNALFESRHLSDRRDALSDPADRISNEFEIPAVMKRRVSFWFDVYTIYGTNDFVIHHSRYPWIVYKHIDTSRFMRASQPYWVNRRKAERYVEKQKRLIRYNLKKLAKRKNYKNLSPLEKDLYNKLSVLSGKRSKVIKYATRRVRVQLGQKDFFLSGLEHSHKYISEMESIFLEKGLPKELTRIPFVESSFNVRARSKAGASGIWQIMPKTGKAFGAKISSFYDERNSPLKATRISANLLKQNYRSLKDWPLAVTAYNHGTGNLRSSLRRSKSKTLPQVISRLYRGSFRFASANFYASFLAALHAETYHRKIFSPDILDKAKPIEAFSVKLKSSASPQAIAEILNINLQKLLDLNLDLRFKKGKRKRLPPGYELYLPATVKRIPTRANGFISQK